MRWILYAPLRAGSWLWRKLWLWVWLGSEFLHIPLGWLAPWVFGQMLGVKGTRMKMCPRCGQTMGAVTSDAKPERAWRCPACETTLPMKRRDRKRWETIHEHQTKKEPDGGDGCDT